MGFDLMSAIFTDSPVMLLLTRVPLWFQHTAEHCLHPGWSSVVTGWRRTRRNSSWLDKRSKAKMKEEQREDQMQSQKLIWISELTWKRYPLPHWSFWQNHNKGIYLFKKKKKLQVKCELPNRCWQTRLKTTDQEEETGAGQPKVSSSVTVNVEVFGRQVTVWVEDLKCSLKQKSMLLHVKEEFSTNVQPNHLEGFLITSVSLPAWWSSPEIAQQWSPAHALYWTCSPGDLRDEEGAGGKKKKWDNHKSSSTDVQPHW